MPVKPGSDSCPTNRTNGVDKQLDQLDFKVVIEEKEIGAFEAKNKLSALLDEAAGGQRIWITKHGRRVALLSSGVGGGSGSKQPSLCGAFRRIRSAGKPGPETLKDLIEEGRR